MSFTPGQLVGAAVGAAVGFFTFNPAAGYTVYAAMAMGASIGMTVGGIVDPPPQTKITQEGARLGDLTTQTSQWGTPIPRLFGAYRMSGNVIWSLKLHETRHVEESGEGKGGGGGTKTETIWYSYAGSWAVGFCEGEISGITRIWFDSVLVFDGTNYSGGLNYGNHTIYKGSDDQVIDWYMDDGNTPAYRGLCYIVFRSIELENYGNKIPKVSVEVSKSVSINSPTFVKKTYFDETSNSNNYRYSYCMYPGLNGIASTNNVGFQIDLVEQAGAFVDYHLPHVNKDYGPYFEYRYYSVDDQERYGPPSMPVQVNTSLYNWTDTKVYYTKNGHFELISSSADSTYRYLTLPNEVVGGIGDILIDDVNIQDICPYGDGFLQLNSNDKLYVLDENFNQVSELDLDWGLYVPTFGTHVQLRTRLINVDGDIVYVASGDIEGIFLWGYFYFWSIDLGSGDITYYGTTGSDPDNVRYSNGSNYSYMTAKDEKVTMFQHSYTSSYYTIALKSLSNNAVTVASIAEELFLRAGLTTSQFDVTEGTDLVYGYTLPRPMETRSAIEPLISAYQLDLIEVDGKLKLKKRDPTNIVTTIDSFINHIEIERMQTVELSKTINIAYANKDKNYDIGVQSSLRNDADALNSKTYQYPMALSDDQAKKISELYLYSEWNQRTEFKFSLSLEYLYLEPSDTIKLDYENDIFTVRLTKVDYASNKQLNCEATLEASDIYVSTATGSDTNTVGVDGEAYLIYPSKFEVLDIPMLDNVYDYEGVYIAATGLVDGWVGCNIDRSSNAGESYTTVGSVTNGTVIGAAIDALSDGPCHILDNVNTVTVSATYGELFDTDYDSLLNSANYIALGSEILQYQNATDNGDGTFTLDTLLRGRRGTEWATNTHAIGEAFVFLSTGMMFDATANLNTEYYYKATTFTLFLEDSKSQTIIPEIVCKKPLSPWYVKGYRDGSNNLIISWMRRSRDVTGYLKTLSLMEETESYEIEITTGTGRTLTSTTETVTYTATDQTTDGITLGNPVTFTVYQMSGYVGRGYGTEETI